MSKAIPAIYRQHVITEDVFHSTECLVRFLFFFQSDSASRQVRSILIHLLSMLCAWKDEGNTREPPRLGCCFFVGSGFLFYPVRRFIVKSQSGRRCQRGGDYAIPDRSVKVEVSRVRTEVAGHSDIMRWNSRSPSLCESADEVLSSIPCSVSFHLPKIQGHLTVLLR
jgi:hypothetical protein